MPTSDDRPNSDCCEAHKRQNQSVQLRLFMYMYSTPPLPIGLSVVEHCKNTNNLWFYLRLGKKK